jgi:hypothetical protein
MNHIFGAVLILGGIFVITLGGKASKIPCRVFMRFLPDARLASCAFGLA